MGQHSTAATIAISHTPRDCERMHAPILRSLQISISSGCCGSENPCPMRFVPRRIASYRFCVPTSVCERPAERRGGPHHIGFAAITQGFASVEEVRDVEANLLLPFDEPEQILDVVRERAQSVLPAYKVETCSPFSAFISSPSLERTHQQ